MKTMGEALANPNSNLNENVRKAQETMQDNEAIIAQWMATGLTREQAWAKALA